MNLTCTPQPQPAGRWLASIVWVWLAGCASVPPEAVTLSRHVGSQISLSQEAHLSTLDAFYKRLRDDNDKWMTDTYLPRLVKNTVDAMSAACRAQGDNTPTCSRLVNDDMQGMLSKTITYRDDLQRVLAANRDQARRLIQSHYADLQTANATVTATLASVVDLKKATRDSAAQIGQSVGLRIDTDKIEQTVADFLQRTGGAGSSLSELEKSLSAITQMPATR